MTVVLRRWQAAVKQAVAVVVAQAVAVVVVQVVAYLVGEGGILLLLLSLFLGLSCVVCPALARGAELSREVDNGLGGEGSGWVNDFWSFFLL